MDGYVLATDLLPTILDRYGIEVPDDVSGQPIEPTEGAGDAAAVAERETRLGQISDRRWETLAVNLLIWLAVGLVAVLIRRDLARAAAGRSRDRDGARAADPPDRRR